MIDIEDLAKEVEIDAEKIEAYVDQRIEEEKEKAISRDRHEVMNLCEYYIHDGIIEAESAHVTAHKVFKYVVNPLILIQENKRLHAKYELKGLLEDVKEMTDACEIKDEIEERIEKLSKNQK